MSTLRANRWQGTDGTVLGAVLQVRQTYITGDKTFSASGSAGNTTWQDVPGFNVSITPRSASNRILVSCTFKCSAANSAGTPGNPYWGGRIYFNIGGGAYNIMPPVGDPKSGSEQAHFNISPDRTDGAVFRMTSCNVIQILHSPNTTSVVNYKLAVGGFIDNLYFGSPINGGGSDDNYWTEPYGITVMEIQA
jgi:hypothetical protein